MDDDGMRIALPDSAPQAIFLELNQFLLSNKGQPELKEEERWSMDDGWWI